MMESPFFSSHWSNFHPRSRYSPSVREVPVHRPAAKRSSSSPKVVSIPVYFVGSERNVGDYHRTDSALKIQKVFRGFLVRKNMKKIAAIREEVNEIERKMSRRETVEAIRRDSMERLKLNETLMSLLFRLDSVRGVDSGVRDCRKAVIKKAIALQERVDAIVAGDQIMAAADEASEVANVESVSESAEEAPEAKDSGVFSGGDDDDTAKTEDPALEWEPKAYEVDPSAELCADCLNSSDVELDQTVEKEEQPNVMAQETKSEVQNHDEPMTNSTMAEEVATNDISNLVQIDEAPVEDEVKVGDSAMAENKETMVENLEESVGTSSSDSESGDSASSVNPRNSIEGDAAAKNGEDGVIVQQQPDRNREENWSHHQRRSKELLERMMEDNEKMMGLMADLFERNHTQMQLLSSLSQRVEQLERAFVCEKLRKKKKKKRAATDCSGKCPNAAKKCENR